MSDRRRHLCKAGHWLAHRRGLARMTSPRRHRMPGPWPRPFSPLYVRQGWLIGSPF